MDTFVMDREDARELSMEQARRERLERVGRQTALEHGPPPPDPEWPADPHEVVIRVTNRAGWGQMYRAECRGCRWSARRSQYTREAAAAIGERHAGRV